MHVKHASHCALAVTDFLRGLKITAHLLRVVLFVGGNWSNVLLLLMLGPQREAENTVSGQGEGKKCVANVRVRFTDLSGPARSDTAHRWCSVWACAGRCVTACVSARPGTPGPPGGLNS